MKSDIIIIFQVCQSYFDTGWQKTKVYILERLEAGHIIDGPAIIINGNRFV